MLVLRKEVWEKRFFGTTASYWKERVKNEPIERKEVRHKHAQHYHPADMLKTEMRYGFSSSAKSSLHSGPLISAAANRRIVAAFGPINSSNALIEVDNAGSMHFFPPQADDVVMQDVARDDTAFHSDEETDSDDEFLDSCIDNTFFGDQADISDAQFKAAQKKVLETRASVLARRNAEADD